jgi:hypothetical protein
MLGATGVLATTMTTELGALLPPGPVHVSE